MIFRIFFAIVILSGCQNNSSNAGIDYSDTAISITSPQRKIDTADEKKAFGEIKFGMSGPQVEKAQDIYGFVPIGTYKYFMHPSYDKQGEMYQLEIQGMTKNADFFYTETRDDYQNITDVILKKYGKPDDESPYPSLSDMNNGYIKFSQKWNIGDKVIEIGVGERDASFYSVCWIYSKSRKGNVQNQYQEEGEEKIKKDANKF